jgi:endoribonuclease Dicer
MSGGQHAPVYDLDPPDLPEGWHATQGPIIPYQGPWGCVVTLPRLLDQSLRVFKVDRKYTNKVSARNHVAFEAYRALYHAKLLNDHLLPITIELEQDEEIKQLLSDIERRTGTATVSPQLDPWAPSHGSDGWWRTNIEIDGLPSIQMLTYGPCFVQPYDPPGKLYPGNRSPVTMRLVPLGNVYPSSKLIDDARRFTRRIFWAIHHGKMNWDELDYAYLFLPISDDDSKWNDRRTSAADPADDEIVRLNAAVAGQRFSYPQDLTLIIEELLKGRPSYMFLRWHFERLTDLEEEALRSRNPRKYSDIDIVYPLLAVQPTPRRRNFLAAVDPLAPQATSEIGHVLLPAEFSTAVLLPKAESEYALYLPSIIRYTAMTMTAGSLRETLFPPGPLRSIPLNLLTMAITAPASGEVVNYQRLETLGDTTLKLLASVNLLSDYPLWHEGYLSRKKDHGVANVRLAKVAISRELYRWIIQDRFVPKKWRPKLAEWNRTPSGDSIHDTKEPEKRASQLSTKMMADVVEALMGAAYLHGSFDLAVEVAQVFPLGISIKPLSVCVESILSRASKLADDFGETVPQTETVERMLGYTFKNKAFLVEALTHASLQGTEGAISYERMEFLGDAVLDMVVGDYLYRRSDKNYGPGHMHLRKQAVVNLHFLAYICLSMSTEVESAMGVPDRRGEASIRTDKRTTYLWQCLLHSSHRILDDQANAFARYERNRQPINRALYQDPIFPWAALTQLQAPKVLSDIVESTIGAVYLDSGGDFEVMRGLLRKYGILPMLERIVDCDVDVQHPVSRLAIWASKEKRKVRYDFTHDKGRITCIIYVDEEEEVRITERYRGHTSQAEVKFIAAERAIRKFRVIPADDMIWEMERAGQDSGDENEELEEQAVNSEDENGMDE